jgi:hypothetical protein
MANHPSPGHYPIRLEDVFNDEELEEIRRWEQDYKQKQNSEQSVHTTQKAKISPPTWVLGTGM